MTGRDLVTASLRLIGAIAPGESLAASEATDGLSAFNRMISSWSTERLLVYSVVRETLVLTASDGDYTVGASGNLNTTRPMGIEKATLIDTAQTPDAEYPLKLLSLAEWTAIVAKDVDGLPTALYADEGYPQSTLYLYPRPSTTYTLALYSHKPMTELATLETVIALPPGYERALIYNFAVEIAPEYGKTVSDPVVMIATESKASLKRLNHRASYLRCDSALTGNGAF